MATQTATMTTGLGDDTLVTPAEARKCLKLSAATLRRYSDEGLIPFVRFESHGMRRYRLGTLKAVVRTMERRSK